MHFKDRVMSSQFERVWCDLVMLLVTLCILYYQSIVLPVYCITSLLYYQSIVLPV